MLFLLTVPYINSNEITFYWFSPAFNLIRFISLLCAAGILNFIYNSLKNKSKHTFIIKKVSILFIILLIAHIIFIPSYNKYINKYKFVESNSLISKKWIETNLIQTHNIAVDDIYTHYLPAIYDPDNLPASKNISRAFMYNRDQNQYLNKIFSDYLENYYFEDAGIKQVKGIAVYPNIPDAWTRDGFCFVTSPHIYTRFLNKELSTIPPELREKHIQKVKSYSSLLQCPLIKAFRHGRGGEVEIYQINDACYPGN